MALTSLSDVKRVVIDRDNDLVLVSCIVASVPAAGDYVAAGSLGLDNIVSVIGAFPGGASAAVANVQASGTVTFATDPAADTATVVIGGITYTFETGAIDADWKVASGADVTASAANLVLAINGVPSANHQAAYPNPFVKATSDAGVVTLTARTTYPGTSGNAITLTTAGDANITVSGAVLAGGVDAALTSAIQALPNTQTNSATQDDAGDVWLSHGSGTQSVRLVVLGNTPGN